MKSVNKSVLIWYSPQQMFDLVADVEHYPEFLPWCDQAKVLERHADGLTGEVGMKLGALHQSFTTRNTHIAEGEVRKLIMNLVKGPFSNLHGEWTFNPVGGGGAPGSVTACRVELKLNYGFSNFALAAVVGPVFEKIATSMVDAFVKRAEQVYG
ncbi:ribosome-associated toxin RatA of RatAB toxin-antitoxin module [Comamonas sp. BIGb0124]|uniref:type II toxin-antitoxin system RatA family toxin n=1 Tax=Comamonas sp. BIGb0124 TaxID=2485130 RepID=UPI000F49ED13|nr:type II toxin-antitoxin system RatA family toxin [Comamonas sp. BIGb0124]ROR24753.1 ribosome-associated toxin RatA of RatAB toxin-antitoxin module [Comamonas sp. BIGb0124]